MSSLRLQNRNTEDGEGELPIVLNNNNFAKGAPGQPTLESGERLRAALPLCNMVVIPRVGAFAPLEDPAAMVAALGEQLDPTLRVVPG